MELEYYHLYTKSPLEKRKITKDCFDFFLSSSYQESLDKYSIGPYIIKKEDLKLMADLYYRQYASDSQRKKYKEGKQDNNNKKIQQRLEKKEISINEKVIMVFKCYQDSGFEESVLRSECKKLKCPIAAIIQYIEDVAITSMSKEDISKFRSIKEVIKKYFDKDESIRKWKQQQKRIISILNLLLRKPKEKALIFLEEQGKQYKDPYFFFHSLQERVEQYVLYFEITPEKQEVLIQLLAEYYIKIQNNIKSIEKDPSPLQERIIAENTARKQAIIKQFKEMVLSGKAIGVYCREQGIPRQTMTENMRNIRIEYPEIFQEYLEYGRQSEEYYKGYKPYVLKLLSFLADSEKHFEELDYYLSIGLDPTYLKKCAKQICNKDENTLISIFVNRLSKLIPIKEIVIYQGAQFVQMNGQVVEVSTNQKQEILSFLKEHNVPLSLKIYQQARERYLMGTLQAGDESTLEAASYTNPQKKITK